MGKAGLMRKDIDVSAFKVSVCDSYNRAGADASVGCKFDKPGRLALAYTATAVKSFDADSPEPPP